MTRSTHSQAGVSIAQVGYRGGVEHIAVQAFEALQRAAGNKDCNCPWVHRNNWRRPRTCTAASITRSKYSCSAPLRMSNWSGAAAPTAYAYAIARATVACAAAKRRALARPFRRVM